MMKLNLLTAKQNEAAERPIEVTQEEFWDYYMKLLNVRNNFSLTEREIRVMAYVLSQDWEKSQFKGEEGDRLRERFRMLRPDLSKMKTQLTLKGFVESDENVRRDTLAVKPIRSFQKYVQGRIRENLPIEINFMFPITIKQR